MTTVTRYDDGQNIFTVPVERCNENTSVEESRYEKMRRNSIIGPGCFIPKKEPSKKKENKTMNL